MEMSRQRHHRSDPDTPAQQEHLRGVGTERQSTPGLRDLDEISHRQSLVDRPGTSATLLFPLDAQEIGRVPALSEVYQRVLPHDAFRDAQIDMIAGSERGQRDVRARRIQLE